MLRLMLQMLIAILPTIGVLLGTFAISCIVRVPALENIFDFIEACCLINVPIVIFRKFIFDFTVPFKKIFDKFSNKQDFTKSKAYNFFVYRVGGTLFSILLSFLLIVTVGYLRPTLHDTYRYKQIDYAIGDTVLVGEHAFLATGLYEAKVVDAYTSNGESTDFFFYDKYILDNGETVPRSRIFGKEDKMDGLLWIPKAYYYGGKYVIEATSEFIKWAI